VYFSCFLEEESPGVGCLAFARIPQTGAPGAAEGGMEEMENRSEKYRNYFNDWGEGKSSEN
jgi:hypothetical protein